MSNKDITKQEDPDEFIPTPGSAAEPIMNAIPEEKKVDDYDYDKLKYEALKEKYAALDLNWNNFEDAIHYESARAARCQAIITHNKKDFEQGELQILTPTEFLYQLNQP